MSGAVNSAGDSWMLVTDQLPWPPRNGITLPLCNQLERLRASRPVSLCLLLDEGAALPPGWAENEARFGPITRIVVRRRARAARLAAEVIGSGMYQHGWVGAPDPALDPSRFTQVWVSPMSALARWQAVRRANPRLQPRAQVAAVNDCTTAEYRWRLRGARPGLLSAAKAWLDRLRVPLIGRVEARLLASCHRVLVQTEADRQAMHDLVGADIARRCLLAPNGVRADLFDVPHGGGDGVLFVAELSGEYGPITEWLCSAVWPLVRAGEPGAQLTIVGRGAPVSLRQRLASTAGVTHVEFVADLGPCYAAAAVVWSPVFKGFGLINKTLEAMASARAVVGARAAFNGIAGFVDGQHGIGLATTDAEAMADATLRLLRSPEQCLALGTAARALVRSGFSWEHSVDALRQAFQEGASDRTAMPATARAPGQPVLGSHR
jgi:glycosyltransferase involved in cell wall biosynthesis